VLLLIIVPALLLRLPGQDIRIGRRVIWTILLALLIGAILSPWVYALLRYSGRFSISVPNPFFYSIAGRWQRFEWIDAWWGASVAAAAPGSMGAATKCVALHPAPGCTVEFPAGAAGGCTARRGRGGAPPRPGGAIDDRRRPLIAVGGMLVLSICQPLQNALTHPIGAGDPIPVSPGEAT